MIKKIKCLLKGHRYLMTYQPLYRGYHQSMSDTCDCCRKTRGNYDQLQTPMIDKMHKSIGVNEL